MAKPLSSNAPNGTAPSTLTFPPSIFAALSPASYLHAHLSQPSGQRANGRPPNSPRQPTINTNSLTHCNGSAVVRLGSTAVVAGVRGEILLAKDVPDPPTPQCRKDDEHATMEKLGLLVPNLELNTGCTPNFIPGSAPSAVAQTLTSRIHQLLYSTNIISLDDLEIKYTPPKIDDDDAEPEEQVIAYWTLYIDIVYISLDGGAFDAAWGAVMAALRETRLPKAWWDGDLETIVCSDNVSEGHKLELRGLPIALSFAIFEERGMGNDEVGRWTVADPDTFEEGLCDEVFTTVVDKSKVKGRILRFEKSGGGVVGMKQMDEIVQMAFINWQAWAQACG